MLPSRCYAHGTWPGITGAGPLALTAMGKSNGSSPIVALTSPEKKMILGVIMCLAVEIMFKTHWYSFKGFVFKQSDGGPNRLRATCQNGESGDGQAQPEMDTEQAREQYHHIVRWVLCG